MFCESRIFPEAAYLVLNPILTLTKQTVWTDDSQLAELESHWKQYLRICEMNIINHI